MSAAKLAHDPELLAFRQEVREFCRTHLPDDIRRKVMLNQHLEKNDYVRWQKILHEKGWIAAHWPQEYGGERWSSFKRYLFEEETSRAGAPWLTPFGVVYAGPVIYTFGYEEQKKRYLPDILTTGKWWCQGYSEPAAGSDLANVKTRAVRDGDHYVVNGQKIWTTMADWADLMFALVRTSTEGKPQDGISFLVIDMHSPGVTVRPIISIDLCHHLNEVFFDDVRVPVENLIGEENKGWTYAKFLLNNERGLSAETGHAKRRIDLLKRLLRETYEGGQSLFDSPVWQRRLAEIDVQLLSLEALAYDIFSQFEADKGGVEASYLKIIGSELGQAITTATMEALTRHGLSYQTETLQPDWNGQSIGPEGAAGLLRDHLHERASTIYAGSNEIQRNIIAKAVLGL